ncbi:GntR family transcriptional regulator [Streptomyces sp. NPDC001941]|uniref:GntR family transcriptional regulator n=1 Tax=Streptomyces sp. NPDC001941 TaxID=3154659 RepID=UPI00332D0C4D
MKQPLDLHPVLRDGSRPIQEQARDALARSLAAAVADGHLAPGARLPAERYLCDRLGVSRATLRKALQALEEDGQVVSTERAGWHLSRPTAPSFQHTDHSVGNLADYARTLGFTPSARVLAARLRPAGFDEAEKLAVLPGAEVFELERVRLFDDLVMCHSHSLVPAERAPGITEPDYRHASLFTELTRRGIVPSQARYTVHAALVPPERAPLLDLAEGAPVLHTEQLTVDQHGRPCEFNRSVYRADRYRFHATLAP